MKHVGGNAVVVGVFGQPHSPYDPLDRLAVMLTKPWKEIGLLSFASGVVSEDETVAEAAVRVAEREVRTRFSPAEVELWSNHEIARPNVHTVNFVGVEVPSFRLPYPCECGSQGEQIELVPLKRLLTDPLFLNRHRRFLMALRDRI